MWEQSLSGLIKALRASRHDEAKVVQAALGDIASEIKSNDWELKAGAVLKLTYLDMLGYPHLSQHAFQVIECMSCPRFHIKQIGYLAASHAFAPGSQVLLLTHNLIKKDLTSNTASQPVALLQTLSTLPSIISSSSQLSHDLEPELLKQLSHSKSAVRRAAVLVLGSLWRSAACPSESAILDRLGDKLLDQDPSVVNATVNVMLELARSCSSDQEREPFLRLAPECFELLTTSNNNWMLIKLVKLFALLTPIEPRLVRKLIPPITNLISTTPAMSLLYECIHAVIAGGMLENNESLAKVCVQKLAAFLNDEDQNLRYIALLAINKLVPSHPHLVTNHSSTILRCVDDDDLSIRSRALDLLEGMVDKHNLPVIVRKILSQLTGDAMTASTAQAYHSSPAAAALSSIANGSSSSASGGGGGSAGASPAYKAEVVSVMLRILQQYNYGNVTDFEWLVDLLIELAYISTTLPSASEKLQRQVGDVLIDVTARARAIRPYAVQKCIEALPDNVLLDAPAWIVGEYCTDSSIGGESSGPQWSHAIRTLVQAGQVHAAVKVYAKWAAFLADSGSWEQDADALEAVKHQAEALRDAEAIQHTQELLALLTMTVANLQLPAGPPKPTPSTSYDGSADPQEDNPFAENTGPAEEKEQPAAEEETQGDGHGVPLGLRLLKSLYLPELNPVNPKAQSLVGEPEGLNLNAWIVPSSIAPLPLHERSSSNGYGDDVDEYGRPNGGFAQPLPLDLETSGSSSKKEKKSKKKESGEGGEKKKKKKSKKRKDEEMDSDDVDNIPIVKLDMSELASGLPTAEKAAAPAAASTSVATKELKKERPVKPVVIDVDGELPPESAMRRPSPAPTAATQSDLGSFETVDPELQTTEQTEQEKPSTPTPIVVKKVNKDKKKKKKPAATATEE